MIDVDIKRHELNRIDRAIDRMVRETGRDTGQAVMRAAITFAQSGKKAAKPGKRAHDVRPAELTAKGRKKRGSTWMVVQRQQVGGDRFIDTGQTKKPKMSDPVRRVANRGLAQRSWSWTLAKLGKRSSSEKANKGAVRAGKFVRVRKRIGGIGRDQFVNMRNQLSYLKVAYPNIENNALRAAGKKLAFLVAQGIEKQARKANGGT